MGRERGEQGERWSAGMGDEGGEEDAVLEIMGKRRSWRSRQGSAGGTWRGERPRKEIRMGRRKTEMQPQLPLNSQNMGTGWAAV